jgi:hypothetical protein
MDRIRAVPTLLLGHTLPQRTVRAQGIYYGFNGEPGLSGRDGAFVLPGVAADGLAPAGGLDGPVAFAGGAAGLFPVLAQAAARTAFSADGGVWHETGTGAAFCRS